jgi:hypothetical protein
LKKTSRNSIITSATNYFYQEVTFMLPVKFIRSFFS